MADEKIHLCLNEQATLPGPKKPICQEWAFNNKRSIFEKAYCNEVFHRSPGFLEPEGRLRSSSAPARQ